MGDIDVRSRIIGSIFLLERKLDSIGNREFGAVGLTTKQWFVLINIAAMGENASISKVAENLSTSHQNIKQIALQLQKKGFIDIVPDENDARKQILMITDESRRIWNEREDIDVNTIRMVTAPLTDRESKEFLNKLELLIANLENL